MPTLKIRMELNKGRIGIPMEKLAGIVKDMREFLAMVCEDVGLPGDEWLALDFKNSSVIFDCEKLDLSPTEKQIGYSGLRAVIADDYSSQTSALIRPATRMRYSNITKRIDPDEVIGIGLFNGSEAPEMFTLTHEQSSRISEENEKTYKYHGEIQGIIHAFYKEVAEPKLVVRELSTRNLVHCFFGSGLYESAVQTLSEPDAVVFVEGEISEDMTEGVKSVAVTDFQLAPPFDPVFFESFIGSKPQITGYVPSEDFLAETRSSDEQ